MNGLTVTGKQSFMGKEIPVVLGGFEPNERSICDKTIAEIHSMETFKVRERISRNIKRFIRDVDYVNLAERIRQEDTLELATQ